MRSGSTSLRALVITSAIFRRGWRMCNNGRTPWVIASISQPYRNRGTAEIATRDGQVVLMLDGGAPMAVTRIAANRDLARPKPDLAGPEFVLQAATAEAPAYLRFALWAYAR